MIEITNAVYDSGQLSVDFTTLEGELPNVGDHVALTIDTVTKYPIENDTVTTTDNDSHAEGDSTTGSSDGSHTEGETTTSGDDTHTEGAT